MSYSSLSDIKKLIPEETIVQLTDDGAIGSIDEAVVNEAIAQADAEIDSYCGGRYKVPLSPAPNVARKLSADIAIHTLYSRRSDVIPQARLERYRSAVGLLEGISKGTISLGIDPAPPASADNRAETNVEADRNVFSRDSLEGF